MPGPMSRRGEAHARQQPDGADARVQVEAEAQAEHGVSGDLGTVGVAHVRKPDRAEQDGVRRAAGVVDRIGQGDPRAPEQRRARLEVLELHGRSRRAGPRPRERGPPRPITSGPIPSPGSTATL